MTNEDLQKLVLQIEPLAICTENKQFLIAEIPSKSLFILAKSLFESPETKFDYLYSLTGIDMNPLLGVVYHLESTELKHTIVLKAFAENRENPTLDSLCAIWKGVELQEREVFDLFGITFTNHPDMRRIFMDDDWKGFPLRKDYVDTINIVDLIK